VTLSPPPFSGSLSNLPSDGPFFSFPFISNPHPFYCPFPPVAGGWDLDWGGSNSRRGPTRFRGFTLIYPADILSEPYLPFCLTSCPPPSPHHRLGFFGFWRFRSRNFFLCVACSPDPKPPAVSTNCTPQIRIFSSRPLRPFGKTYFQSQGGRLPSEFFFPRFLSPPFAFPVLGIPCRISFSNLLSFSPVSPTRIPFISTSQHCLAWPLFHLPLESAPHPEYTTLRSLFYPPAVRNLPLQPLLLSARFWAHSPRLHSRSLVLVVLVPSPCRSRSLSPSFLRTFASPFYSVDPSFTHLFHFVCSGFLPSVAGLLTCFCFFSYRAMPFADWGSLFLFFLFCCPWLSLNQGPVYWLIHSHGLVPPFFYPVSPLLSNLSPVAGCPFPSLTPHIQSPPFPPTTVHWMSGPPLSLTLHIRIQYGNLISGVGPFCPAMLLPFLSASFLVLQPALGNLVRRLTYVDLTLYFFVPPHLFFIRSCFPLSSFHLLFPQTIRLLRVSHVPMPLQLIRQLFGFFAKCFAN